MGPTHASESSHFYAVLATSIYPRADREAKMNSNKIQRSRNRDRHPRSTPRPTKASSTVGISRQTQNSDHPVTLQTRQKALILANERDPFPHISGRCCPGPHISHIMRQEAEERKMRLLSENRYPDQCPLGSLQNIYHGRPPTRESLLTLSRHLSDIRSKRTSITRPSGEIQPPRPQGQSVYMYSPRRWQNTGKAASHVHKKPMTAPPAPQLVG